MSLRFFKKSKKMLDISVGCAIIQKLSEQRTKYGGIAQLGERLNGIQEVSGSIPLISTKTNRKVGLLFCPESLSGIHTTATRSRLSPPTPNSERSSVFFVFSGVPFWQFPLFIYHPSTSCLTLSLHSASAWLRWCSFWHCPNASIHWRSS